MKHILQHCKSSNLSIRARARIFLIIEIIKKILARLIHSARFFNFCSVAILLFFASSILLAISSYYTSPRLNLVEMSIATIYLVYYVRTARFASRLKLPTMLFLYGALFHAVAFYWLTDTLIAFGKFTPTTAWIGFVAFCIISGVQFFLCGLLYQFLEKTNFCKIAMISFPLAWCVTEWLYPRLFPWYLMNLHLSWSSFATFVEYLPLPVLAGIFLWWLDVILFGRRMAVIYTAVFSFAFCILYGNIKNYYLLQGLERADTIRIALVQADADSIIKRDPFVIERYKELTERLLESTTQPLDVIIWPESSVNFWLLTDTQNIRDTIVEGIGHYGVPLLFGGMTMERAPNDSPSVRALQNMLQYNTVVGVNADGSITGMYHKQVLVPIGEYLPFEKYFKTLRRYSPETGSFDSGSLNMPIPITIASNKTINFGILICYEDLMPRLAREMTRNGADVLVSFSNDIWLRRDRALAQHTFLSMWRAVENKRYLLRVTNTGWTTVINPLGEIVAELPLHQATTGVFEIKVH